MFDLLFWVNYANEEAGELYKNNNIQWLPKVTDQTFF
jgi:hypothetical protein